MGDALTRADLESAANSIKEYVGARIDGVEKLNDERFAGVNARLDKVNGSIARHEGAIGKHGETLAAQRENLKGLNHEVFDATRPRTPAESTIKAIRMRDAKLIGVAFAAMGGVVELLHQLGSVVLPFVLHLLTKGH